MKRVSLGLSSSNTYLSTLNLISTEEAILLESGENADERQDEESFALAEIKQGT